MTDGFGAQSQKSATELARLDERTRKTENDLANMERLHREEMRSLAAKIEKQGSETMAELKLINRQLNRGYGGFAVIVSGAGILGGIIATNIQKIL